MNIGQAFAYVFHDRDDWFRKIAFPALCGLIPIIGPFIVSGWSLKAARNVMEGQSDDALPELNFGQDLGRGLMAALITVIYSIPTIILIGLSVPLFVQVGNGESSGVLLAILGGCLALLGIVIGILLMLLSVLAVAHYVARGKFGAAFRFKELFAILKKGFGNWLLVLLAQFVALSIIAPLGSIACGIGALLTSAYGQAVYAHIMGQAYRLSTEPDFVMVQDL